MGANMARRLIRGGHECVVFDRSQKAIDELVADGANGTTARLAGMERQALRDAVVRYNADGSLDTSFDTEKRSTMRCLDGSHA